ncbi:ferredoxin III, nif-specific [Celerinatantimonas sp. MCCC 1A17872]|uniref:ferredoxin III, nif-specific n=1 Tax=Celerinatantimonas sp. MCCC 1A17872 TaxID=3177514 RepID=UPI0038BEBC8F
MVTAVTADGSPWEPQFIRAVDSSECIGCGRCYKVCGRNVFELVENEDDDGDDDWSDDVRMVMTVSNAGDCIGCGACERVCPKDCHQH